MSELSQNASDVGDFVMDLGGAALCLPILGFLLTELKKHHRLTIINCGPVDPFMIGIFVGEQKSKG